MPNTNRLHHTRTIHADGAIKDGGVRSENLDSMIEALKAKLPAQAIFVDGVCQYRGEFQERDITLMECRILSAGIVPVRETSTIQ